MKRDNAFKSLKRLVWTASPEDTNRILEYIVSLEKQIEGFNSQTCENCKHYDSFNESSGICILKDVGVDEDLSCKKWERIKK